MIVIDKVLSNYRCCHINSRTICAVKQTSICCNIYFFLSRYMKELKPVCDPNGVYSVKRTCAELGISHKTLRKYRENGYIEPVNPDNVRRPKYSGKSIIDCWEKLIRL